MGFNEKTDLGQTEDLAHSPLVWCALFYLYLPVLIFSGYWILPIISIPLCAMGLTCFYLLFRDRSMNNETISGRSSFRLWPVLTISFIWVTTSGIWGLGFSRADDWKMAREDYLSSLFSLAWPISHQFTNDGPVYYFRHYLAYYITGPFFAKILGLGIDSVLLITGIWTLVGVVIVLLLVNEFVGSKGSLAWIPSLFFVIFSGLDILGARLKGSAGLTPQSFLHAGHIEWWARQFQFSSTTTLLHWVPQHAIVGWIGALVALNLKSNRSFLRIAPILLGVTLLWSPFATVGIAMVVLMAWFPYAHEKIKKISRRDFIFLIFSLFNGALIATYILSGSGGLHRSLLFNERVYAMGGYSAKNGAINTFMNLIIFLALEIGPYVLFVYFLNKTRRQMVVGTLIGLFLCTQIVMSNDSLFTMRASIPLLAVLAVLVGETLMLQFETKRFSLQIVSLVAIVLIGSITPIIETVARIDSAEEPNMSLQLPCIVSGCNSDMTNPDKLAFDWTEDIPWFMRQP